MEILSPFQQKIIEILAGTEESNLFYLTGGTALAAFYLQHRLSEDLDFFTGEEELVGHFGDRLKRNLEHQEIRVEIIHKLKSFYEMLASQGNQTVRIHLAQDSPFRFAPPDEEKTAVKVDSLIDLATNKLLTLYGRYEVRDFIDVYFLIKDKFYTLQELIQKSQQKDEGLDLYYLAAAFHRAKDLPDESNLLPVAMLKPLNIKELKEYFVKEALAILDEIKPKA